MLILLCLLEAAALVQEMSGQGCELQQNRDGLNRDLCTLGDTKCQEELFYLPIESQELQMAADGRTLLQGIDTHSGQGSVALDANAKNVTGFKQNTLHQFVLESHILCTKKYNFHLQSHQLIGHGTDKGNFRCLKQGETKA